MRTLRPATSEELRQAFLEYFEEHGHQRVPSASLIPYNDETLLLTNAGMVQFKDVFLGLESRPYRRAATAQKCMRVTGKHNDLENVGPSTRHHTFFEMLGNFSFGDYFKREAIRFAYEFLTLVTQIEPARLYYTVFEEDDEAFDIWTHEMGIDPQRVYRMGEKTNFWSMGDVGPCGPTSEIHYDWGVEACTCGQPDCSVFLDNGCERWLEIWNLVFMQFNQDANGVRTPLPRPGVDTGMGLERIVSVLQGAAANYDTDLFTPILDHIQALLGHTAAQRQQHTVAYRVIADHARAAAFLVADGVRPAAAEAGYVLRLVIRRAFRYGRKIGFDGPFLAAVCEAVIAKMGGVYPELQRRRDLIAHTVTLEEEQFISTLDRAQLELDRALAELARRNERMLSGAVAFELKATHGLPFEVTRDICVERGYSVDEEGFRAADEAHRRASQGRLSEATYAVGADAYARALAQLQDQGLLPQTGVEYDPYGALQRQTRLLGILSQGRPAQSAAAGDQVELILAETPFYVESGGQVGDTGRILGRQEVQLLAEVELLERGDGWQALVHEARRPISGLVVHRATITAGEPHAGDAVLALVDEPRRWDVMRNHTATHLLHEALRRHLGRHVHQAGSLVAPDRLRFDFTHEAALTPAQLRQVTDTVNQAILAGHPIIVDFKPLQQALDEGVMALFGEKYGEIVRTVFLGDCDRFCSHELCGGTHVANTAQIGLFLIASEGSAAAGVRRIEALTGAGALAYALQHIEYLQRLAHRFNTPADGLDHKVQELKEQVVSLKVEVQRLRQQVVARQVDGLSGRAHEVAGVNVLATRVEAAGVEGMRSLADDLRNKIGSGIVVLGAVLAEKPTLIAAITPDLVQRGAHAGQLVKSLGPIMGGSGGGRADMAQAGGKDASLLDAALAAVPAEVERQLQS